MFRFILESVDILAERVRRIGGTTIRSIGHIVQLQTIGDDNDGFVPPEQMIQRLLGDNLHMAEMQRAAIVVWVRDLGPVATIRVKIVSL